MCLLREQVCLPRWAQKSTAASAWNGLKFNLATELCFRAELLPTRPWTSCTQRSPPMPTATWRSRLRSLQGPSSLRWPFPPGAVTILQVRWAVPLCSCPVRPVIHAHRILSAGELTRPRSWTRRSRSCCGPTRNLATAARPASGVLTGLRSRLSHSSLRGVASTASRFCLQFASRLYFLTSAPA